MDLRPKCQNQLPFYTLEAIKMIFKIDAIYNINKYVYKINKDMYDFWKYIWGNVLYWKVKEELNK